jgi:small GTP-binding protein
VESLYAKKKNELLKLISEIQTLQINHKMPLDQFKEKLEHNIFNIVVMGQFKRGKTSLINTLIGDDLLPVAVVPLTSIATIITYGEDTKISVCFNDGRCETIEINQLADYVTEKGNPKNIKDVAEVYITYPSKYLKDGVRLIDTPGVGSVYQHNTDVAYRYLPKSDAVFFLVSVDQPMSQNELDFLKDVKEYSSKIFFILNKKDYLNDKELLESVEFIKNVLSEIYQSPKIYPISAKMALLAKKENNPDLLKKSGIEDFLAELNRFLMEEKGNVLLEAVTKHILKTLMQTEFEIDLEIKSMKMPLGELEEKLKLFEEKKTEILQKKSDFEILLEGEIKNLIKNVLEEDINNHKKQLTTALQKELEKKYLENKKLPLNELYKTLEDAVISEIKLAFDKWMPKEDEKLSKMFEKICNRFSIDVDNIIEELVTFASELFGENREFIKTEAVWEMKSDFYYRFKRESLMIDALSTTFTMMLPKFIGDKVLLNKLKNYLVTAVDMQSGNIRYDFAERLNKSKVRFKWEMFDKISSAVEGIENAIKKGIDKKDKSELEIKAREEVLLDLKSKIQAYKTKLSEIIG